MQNQPPGDREGMARMLSLVWRSLSIIAERRRATG